MKLYLSSYKLGNKQEELKEWLKTHDNHIILIANSRDVYEDTQIKQEKINQDMQELQNLGFKVKQLSLKEYFEAPEKLREFLKDYHAFYVIGGNTFALRIAMKLSGFDKYLKEIATNENYLYIGYSAGICVLAPSLQGMELVDEPINPYSIGKVTYEGVGLLDYVPVPHYQSDHPESKLIDDVVQYMKENHLPYKTLRDGDVIIEEY